MARAAHRSLSERGTSETKRGDPLALRVGTHASNIYAIESGRRDARLSTVEALVAATDARLLIVDTGRRASAADTAETLRRDLDDAHRAQALVQLSSNLKSVGLLAKAALTTDPPLPLAPTWDAAIAGIVEHELTRSGLPSPPWVSDVQGLPDGRWDPWTAGRLLPDADRVPEPLRRRGVWIDEVELVSA